MKKTTMRFPKKFARDEKWLQNKSWSFPATELHPLNDAARRLSRLPLSLEMEQLRRDHMKSLKTEGASYALIGKLYDMDRSVVRKIINDII